MKKRLKDYVKYYSLEDYLFGEVSRNFYKDHSLSAEDFFAIIIWKSNRSKTKIVRRLKQEGLTVSEIVRNIRTESREGQLQYLIGKKIGIGIPIASAILAVCYPKDFTVVDYRVIASLKALKEEVEGNPKLKPKAYFDYIDKCKKIAKDMGVSLRQVDKVLWGYDFYEGKNGLKELANKLK